MALSVDWSTIPYLITIPKSDVTLISGTRYQLDVDIFWELLREFSWTAEAAGAPVTYSRIPSTSSTPSITSVDEDYYQIQFEDGLYSVDIINGNTNWPEVEVKNQVSVFINNTTGFINPTFLELGLFNGQVAIDTINGVAGTDKTPDGLVIGTRQAPALDVEDALIIANTRGLNVFNLVADLTLFSGDFSTGFTWTSDRRQITLTINAGANVTGCQFHDLTLVGELDGENSIRNCDIQAVTSLSGDVFQCNLGSTIGINGRTQFDQCFSSVEGTGYPSITGIGTNILIVRDMRGSLGISGMTGGTHSIGVYGGRIINEATSTGGTLHARGDPFEILNLGSTTVIDETGEAQIKEIYQRLDLDPDKPNTYTNDGSNIVNADFTITKTDTGIVSIVTRS